MHFFVQVLKQKCIIDRHCVKENKIFYCLVIFCCTFNRNAWASLSFTLFVLLSNCILNCFAEIKIEILAIQYSLIVEAFFLWFNVFVFSE